MTCKDTAERRIHSIQIEKVATYNSDRKKIYLISNKSFRPIVIDYFSTHSYTVIFHNILYLL